jgi:hypothetical protein
MRQFGYFFKIIFSFLCGPFLNIGDTLRYHGIYATLLPFSAIVQGVYC